MATTADGRTIELSRDEKGRRYLATVEGTVIGEAEFLLTPNLIVFTHTSTRPEFEGQGVGSTLVQWALADARDNGYQVLASCPFVRGYLERHESQYADLIYRSASA